MPSATKTPVWVESYFYVDHDPDLFRVKEWAEGVASVRVIQTVVGAYGAIDTKYGTTYFDVGDALAKLGAPLNTVIVVNKRDIERARYIEA